MKPREIIVMVKALSHHLTNLMFNQTFSFQKMQFYSVAKGTLINTTY